MPDEKPNYLIAGLAGLLIGLLGGGNLVKYQFKPNSVYATEVNGDNRPDLVVKNKHGDKFVYIQQEDGTYKLLSQLQKEQRESIEAKVKDLK